MNRKLLERALRLAQAVEARRADLAAARAAVDAASVELATAEQAFGAMLVEPADMVWQVDPLVVLESSPAGLDLDLVTARSFGVDLGAVVDVQRGIVRAALGKARRSRRVVVDDMIWRLAPREEG